MTNSHPLAADPSPRPRAITGLLSGVTFVGAIVGAMKIAKGPIPRPGSSADAIRTYYRDSAPAARFSAAGQLVSLILLSRFSRDIAGLARTSAGTERLSRGVLATGTGSVALLALSAATHVSLTSEGDRTDETVRRTASRVFGGPVHGVVYGLFVGLTSAVAERTGLLGPLAARAGRASAVAGMLSPAYFRWENAGWLIPIGRFGGYVVTGIVSVRLARGSRRAGPARPDSDVL